MRQNIESRLTTEATFLKDLISDIQSGEIKVPKFQRRFVWNSEQAISLLDSLANSYPIGSLLLWKTKQKLTADRNIGEFRLPETDDLTPTQYVLDGQQRLTVIYSCFGAPVNEAGFAAGYDLQTESFVPMPAPAQLHIFPLRFTYNTTRLLDFRTALKAHGQGDVLQERLDGLIHVITGYKLPVVTLKELTIEEVCPIFERINSSGTKLSTYDLMVAATWSEEFDLDDAVREIAAALEPKGFGDIKEDVVLKCLSAVQQQNVTRPAILSLRELTKDELRQATERTKEALLRSVDLLSTEFGIYSWDFLPYEALIIVLSTVHSQGGALSGAEMARVRQWFWRAAWAERYRGASEAFVTRELDLIPRFVREGHMSAEELGNPPGLEVLQSAGFRSNNSRSRALVLTLALAGPRNITNGAHIDTAEALSIFNKKQFHHIYPKAHLDRVGTDRNSNALANIAILAASENRSISDEDPQVYLPKAIKDLGAQADVVFESNLLPRPSLFDYTSATYDDFLVTRAEALHAAIVRVCSGEY